MSQSSSEQIEYLGETKARRPAVAVALSILCPGLGYMYAGQLLKGVTVNLMFLLLLETFVIVFSILKFFPLLPMLVLIAGWIVFTGFVSASVLKETRNDEPYVLRGFNHWTIYSVVFVLSYAAPILATAHFISQYLLGLNRIESAAMVPTLQVGDMALVDKSAFRNGAPKRGDLVAVQLNETDPVHVLRVVGVENDIIRIEGENVFVNNEPLNRTELDDTAMRVPSLDGEGDLLAMVEENHGNKYVISVSPKAFIAHSMPPTKLAEDEVFVLADNRSQVPAQGRARIRDSRDFGAIKSDQVTGQPLYIAWSSDASGTNWERIGLQTQ